MFIAFQENEDVFPITMQIIPFSFEISPNVLIASGKNPFFPLCGK